MNTSSHFRVKRLGLGRKLFDLKEEDKEGA
jgi:hypothetical protein